ncbi:hypothetical protein WG907_04960 [Sphingobium sp. AN558]|uniref:hypothetical protein n=1 Tax=Sphingobium sp. AN558 TaxID=3133442 RepID=UPI0030BAF1FC
MEQRSLIERLARHLAAGEPDHWQAKVEDAANIIAIMKEPDAAMREAGDDGNWRAMIDAALRERWEIAPTSSGDAQGVRGFDEEGEMQLPDNADTGSRAGWIHVKD